ncbi:phenylacetate-CoA oxygenase subunit PaaJ [Corynebacterium sp. YIM 101645]|uniref:Phenylacetate-CoA oxygenase subunit PaaJ n=1 Tax=Corynebacterium lemuris TaxID=1859292 RepID=A0ABT2FXX9_9CORY|nr:phenylacetate-CoA oxygenase subunit PaaJ [Corynebacterium lemuris]
MNTHPLRPADADAASVWDTAATVPDPEIPVISIADLGILRDAALINGTAVVTITPTYSGCPAMDHITREVKEALSAAGYTDSRVDLVLQPAWTTDWITELGRDQLREYGIAPPTHSSTPARPGPIPLTLAPPPPVACPRCGSTRTRNIAQFGSTSCKALYSCEECLEPFDYFKVH